MCGTLTLPHIFMADEVCKIWIISKIFSMLSCEALSFVLCGTYFFKDALFLRYLLTFETHVK